jgi:hypothetical protein
MTRKRNIESEIGVSATGSSAIPARRKSSSRSRAKYAPAPAETPVVFEVEASAAPIQPPALQMETPAPEVTDGALTQLANAVSGYEPTRDEIAVVAFEYWMARGCQGGSAEEDWLRAEQELRRRSAVSVTA